MKNTVKYLTSRPFLSIIAVMNTQTTCKNCGQNFTITDEEKLFIDKISPSYSGVKYQIPPPELCPNCRLALRTVQRNEQYLYRNKSALSGKPLISLYSQNTEWGKNLKIYDYNEWWSDSFDGMNYGRDFDFNRPFFEQFAELFKEVPLVNLMQLNNENSPFTTGTAYCKNCHLINCSENCQDCYYGKLIQNSRDVMDSDYVYDSELLYECFNVRSGYNSKYLLNSQNCRDCYFSDNLKGCSDCFLCTNLSNKQYHVLNKPMNKDQYEAYIKDYLGSHINTEKAKQAFEDLRKKRVYKYAQIINGESCTGDFLINCKNCTDSYDMNDSQDCKYVTVGVNVKDLIDCSNMYLKPELNYQVLGTIGTYNVIFSLYIFHTQNTAYSQYCFNSNNLFGCCGLKKNEYCILNKQYSRDDYEKMCGRIVEHMKITGEWGTFFPTSLSPFGYNETVAQEYLPLTKEQALSRGYKWKDAEEKVFVAQTFPVPDNIKDSPNDIVDKMLACETCGKNFKIITQELAKLRQMKMPIPHICPDCRHLNRMTMRNPRKLWERQCGKCSTKIITTFSADRKENVYCETCYLKDV